MRGIRMVEASICLKTPSCTMHHLAEEDAMTAEKTRERRLGRHAGPGRAG
jgi:hypothetical protein